MSVDKRLTKYFKSKGIEAKELAQKTGASDQTFYDIVNKGRSPKGSLLEKIFHIYMDLNPIWVMTGKGEMILTEKPRDTRFIEERVDDIQKRLYNMEVAFKVLISIQHDKIEDIEPITPIAGAEDDIDRWYKKVLEMTKEKNKKKN